MTRLLVVRHGQSEWNAVGRSHGWGDPPLSSLGERQAAGAAAALARERLDTGVVASDLQRARRTADILAGHLDLGPVTTDPDLREHDIGDWDGRTWDEIEADWPGARDASIAEEVDEPPNGETRASFHERVWRAVERIGQTGPEAQRLVVAHGGVVRALERLAHVEPHAIAFLSGRWFEWRQGRLRVGDRYRSEQAAGQDL